MSKLKFQRKIWVFDSRKEAIEFLLQNTNNPFYNQFLLRNYEIEHQALVDGFVIAINEVCPVNGFTTGLNEESLKKFMNDNIDIISNEIAWIYKVFDDLSRKRNPLASNLNPYRLNYTDRLLMTYKPFCTRVADTIRNNPKIKDIELENLLVNTIIQLEQSMESYMTELVQYKQRFGELK
jgi:hypothetical protein